MMFVPIVSSECYFVCVRFRLSLLQRRTLAHGRNVSSASKCTVPSSLYPLIPPSECQAVRYPRQQHAASSQAYSLDGIFLTNHNDRNTIQSVRSSRFSSLFLRFPHHFTYITVVMDKVWYPLLLENKVALQLLSLDVKWVNIRIYFSIKLFIYKWV